MAAALRWSAKKVGDGLAHPGTDAVHRLELLPGRPPDGIESPEMERQVPSHRHPDLRDAQRREEATQLRTLPGRDGLHEVGRRLLGEALQRQQLLHREREEIGESVHQLAFHEQVRRFLTQPLDVQCFSGPEVDDAPLELSGTREAVGADRPRPLFVDGRAARRTFGGHLERSVALRLVLQHLHDLRNHVACALDADGVAFTDVLALQFLAVVQGRPGDGDAPHHNRTQESHGREHAGAPHLNPDLLDSCDFLAGLELVGQCPPRVMGRHAQPLPGSHVVELDDHSVDFVVQVVAIVHERSMVRQDLVHRVRPSGFASGTLKPQSRTAAIPSVSDPKASPSTMRTS